MALFFLGLLSLQAQNSCLIKLNIDDCMNCLSLAKELVHLPKELSPKIVLPSEYQGYGHTILKEGINLDWPKESIVYDDALYTSLSEDVRSSVHIQSQSGQSLLTFPLTSLQEFKAFFPAYVSSPKLEEVQRSAPDSSLVYSKQIEIEFSETHLFIHDYLFNRVDIYDRENLKKQASIEGKKLDRKLLFDTFFEDPRIYENAVANDKILKRFNKNYGKIESIWVSNDTLFTFISLPYPKLVKHQDAYSITIDFELVLVSWENNQIREILPFDFFDVEHYDIDQTNAFFIKDGTYYFSVFKSTLHERNHLFAAYKLQNGRLKFEKIYEHLELPTLLTDQQLVYDFSHYNVYQNRILVFQSVPVIYDLENGQNLWPEGQLSEGGKIQMLGTHFDSGTLQLIYEKDGQKYFLKKSAANNQAESFELPTMNKKYKGPIAFLSEDRLLTISSNNQITVLTLH